MADAINIPIKIIDEATSTLSKIQQRVQAFQDDLQNIGKASRHVTKVEDALEEVETATTKAVSSQKKLKNSIQNVGQSVTFFEQLKRDILATRDRVMRLNTATHRVKMAFMAFGKTKSFENIKKALNRITRATSSQNGVISKGNALIRIAVKLWNQGGQAVANVKRKQAALTQQIRASQTAVNGLLGKMKSLVLTYVGVESAKGLVGMSDEASQIGARLNMINDGSQTTAELQNKIYKAAEESRGSYTEMASAVSKLQLLTGDTFKSNEEAIQFTGNLQKMFAICGTGAQESSAAMLQLTQALGSGKLQGDEFRSIMEACPMIVQTLAKHMGVSVGEMKTLASEGEITSEVMRAALLGATEEIDEKFQAMPYTWSQIWASIKNGFTKIMSPVLEKINVLFNENKEKISVFAATASNYILKIVDGITELAGAFINLAGNSGVQTLFETMLYLFTGMIRTVTMILTPIGKFLGYLDKIGVLGPALKVVSIVILSYAMAVNVATVSIRIFNFLLNHTMNILKGVKMAFKLGSAVIKYACTAVSTAIGWISTALYSLAGAIGISIGWLIVIILAVIAVAVALWYYWDEVKAAGIACWNWIVDAAISCYEWIKSAWGTFTGWISGIWNTVKSGAIAAWNGVKNAAISVWQSIWGTIGPLVIAGWNFISAVFRGAWAIISAIMRGIWSVICNVWNSIYGFVSAIVTAYFNYVKAKFTLLKTICLAVWNAIKSAAIAVWQAIYGFVAPIVSRIYSYISSKFNAVRSFCSEIWNSVKTAIVEKVTEIYNKVKEWIEKVVDYFTGLREKMIQKGKDFIQGFIDGVTSMIKKATDTVTEFCDNAVDAINNFFKIGSPSRVMRELGGFVGEGFNLGLEDQINGAKTAAKGLSMETLSGTYAGARTAATGSSSVSPTITINVHNNISSEGDVKKLVDQITVMLRDAMNNSAKGVYNYA